MIRKIASISAATALGQVVQLLVFLTLARMLAPKDFGPYGAFMGILALTTAVGALRYELAFGLVRNQSRLLSVLLVVTGAGLLIATCSSIAAAMLVEAASKRWELFATDWSPVGFAVLVGAGTATLIAGEAMTYLGLRLGRPGAVAVYSLLRPLLIGISQLIFVVTLSRDPKMALILGAVIGQALALLSYSSVVAQTVKLGSRSLGRANIYGVARRFAYLTRSQAPQQLMSRVGLNSLPIALPGYFGAAVGGWYVAANRVLCTPSQVLGKVLRGVYFSEAAERARAGRSLEKLHSSTTGGLLVLSSLYFLPVALFGEEILSVVFGAQWVGAAPMMSILSMFWWSAIVNIPSSALVAPLKLDTWYVRYEAALLAVRMLAIAAGIVLNSYLVLLTLFSIGGLIFNGALIRKVRGTIKDQRLT